MTHRCRAFREKRGLTLREAACLLNVRSTYLDRVEKGYERLSAALSERMAELYGCGQIQFYINKPVD